MTTNRPIPPGQMVAHLEEKLTAALAPTWLDIEDQSDHHIGHAGHDGKGESHFKITIESAAFNGLSRLQRQQRVYAILAEELKRIHALSLVCRGAEE